MDIFDDFPNHLFISLRHKFSATRVVNDEVAACSIKVRLDVSTMEDDTDEYGERLEAAVAKIAYFFNRVLADAVLISRDNEWAVQSFLGQDGPRVRNNVVLCPEDPTDAALAELLMRKINALVGGVLLINGLDVRASDANGMSFTFVGGSPGEGFPSMVEWMGERTFFSKAWWDRDDASTLDVAALESDDLQKPPRWAYSLGFISEKVAEGGPVRDTVVRAEFRPQVIKGGRED